MVEVRHEPAESANRQISQQMARVRKELLKARAEMKAAQARTLKLRQQAEAKATEMSLLRQSMKPMRSS
jgi:uncharacterized protein YggE